MHSSHVQYQPGLISDVPVAAPISAAKPVVSPVGHERILGHRRPAATRDAQAHELNVSGVRVLLALGFAIGLVGLFLWGLVRAWLFAP